MFFYIRLCVAMRSLLCVAMCIVLRHYIAPHTYIDSMPINLNDNSTEMQLTSNRVLYNLQNSILYTNL